MCIAAFACLLAGQESVALAADAQVLYVDDDAPVQGNGLAWDSAFRYLQDALDDARKMPSVKNDSIAAACSLSENHNSAAEPAGLEKISR